MSGRGFSGSTFGPGIRRSATLAPATAGQAPGDAVWIVVTGTADITLTCLQSGTLDAVLAAGLSILPVQATNIVVNSGTAAAKNVWNS